MATIDYKQKIKDYMKSSEVDTLYKSMLNNLFPELAEPEDERMVKFIKNQLFNIKKTITDNYKLDTELTKAIAWLEKKGENGAKGNEREIPNPALSEEDKNMLNRLILHFDWTGNYPFSKGDCDAAQNWLKSLKERYTWKPSLAQLNALSIVSKGYIPCDVDGIISLYNDLKKLWEE